MSGELIADFASRMELSHVFLAWTITAFIRIAQGSATVASDYRCGAYGLDYWGWEWIVYHPTYVFLAIGFGSITLSWMNDSGFWVVQKLSGLTENEMLRTWSLLLTIISLCGLVLSLLGSAFLPFR